MLSLQLRESVFLRIQKLQICFINVMQKQKKEKDPLLAVLSDDD